MMDYAVPRAAWFPNLELDETVTPSPVNPIGVKGVGEAGAIASRPRPSPMPSSTRSARSASGTSTCPTRRRPSGVRSRGTRREARHDPGGVRLHPPGVARRGDLGRRQRRQDHRRRAQPPAPPQAPPRPGRRRSSTSAAWRSSRATARRPTGGVEIGALTTYAEWQAATTMPSVATRDRHDRRRPGPQPRDDRRVDRPRRPGLGRAGDRACVRRLGRPPRAGRRARRSRSTASSRGRSRPGSATTRSSSRSAADRCPEGAGFAYRKLQQKASGYSIVAIAALVATSGGTITHAGIGVTGVHEHPYRAEDVEAALIGTDGSDAAIAAAAAHVTDGVDVNSDIHADAAYRAAMAVVYTKRAIEARSRPLSCEPNTAMRVARITRVGAARRPDRRRSSRGTSPSPARAGRRAAGLTAADLDALAAGSLPLADPVTVLILEPGDLHEDDAALRAGGGGGRAGNHDRGPPSRAGSTSWRRPTASSTSGSPNWSGSTGSIRSRSSPRSTARSSRPGRLVASVKVAPHVVPSAVVDPVVARLRRLRAGLVRVAAVPADPRRGRREGVAPGRRP